MHKLLIATRNPGKLFEISSFLSNLPLKIVSLKDLNITEDVEEDGKSYKENSVKKALFYSKKSGLPTVADDGGLEIDALNGAPGIRSRRYFGKNGKDATDEEAIEGLKKILNGLDVEKTGATFKVVLTLALPNGETFSVGDFVRGILKGTKLKMIKGYPYRSFFFIPEIDKYYHESELTDEEMKKYNHRYKAIQKLKLIIRKFVVNGS